MGGKGNYTILLFIVAILTLTLAVLAAYLFFVGGSSKNNSTDNAQEAKVIAIPDNQRGSFSVFDEKQYLNLKDDGNYENSILIINQLNLIYDKGKKGKNNAAILDKFALYQNEIMEDIQIYFQNTSLTQIKQPDYMSTVKEDLKKLINDLLNSNEKENKEFIYEVVINWFYQ